MSRESLLASGALSPEAQYTPTVSATCGLPKSGEAICGVMIVPVGDVTLVVGQGLLVLGSYKTVLHASPAPLAVARAALTLGARAAAVHVDITLVVGRAGLNLAQRFVGIAITTTLHVAEGPLALGVYPDIFAGQVWLFESDCTDLDLALSSCTDLDLDESEPVEMDLQPLVCR